MDDPVLRVGIVAVATLLVCAVALATRRWQRPVHRRVDASLLALPAGLVMFTSTDCSRCKEALAAARSSGLPLREITWELEPDKFEAASVTAVPLTLAVGPDGAVVDQISGVPSKRWIRRVAKVLPTFSRST